jgi:TolB-like protein
VDVAGTPRYMAPELFHHGASATRATDIYSFGVLLYFLVTGKYPVAGTTLSELRRAHEAGAVRALTEVNADLPPAFVEAVSQATERDPARRPESAAIVQGMLATVAAQPDAPPRARFNRWRSVAVALAIVLVAALAAALLRAPAPAAPANTPLAVLPIRNLTGDPSRQFLADGLTDVLIGHLARVPGLEVSSPANMAALQTEFEREIADRLGARYLLAGSIVQADGRIRLNVMLNDPRAGRTLWATEFDRTPETLLEAGEEIVKWIAARLAIDVEPGS